MTNHFDTLEDAIKACEQSKTCNGVMLVPGSVTDEQQTIQAKRKAPVDKQSDNNESNGDIQARKRKLGMLKDNYDAGDIDKDTYLHIVAMQYM